MTRNQLVAMQNSCIATRDEMKKLVDSGIMRSVQDRAAAMAVFGVFNGLAGMLNAAIEAEDKK